MKLTNREKILLYILVCVIILVVGIFLLIMPAINNHNTLKSEKEAAQLELAAVEKNKVDYSDLDKNIKKVSTDLSEIKKKFYTSMKKEDIDKLITNLCITEGLDPVSLTISDKSSETIVSYSEYLKNSSESTKSTSLADKNKEEKTDETLSLNMYQVDLTVKGKIAYLQTLVNDVKDLKTIKVSEVNYADQTEDDKEMKISFKLYFI